MPNSHTREKCRHGYIKSQCRCLGPRVDIIVPCQDVPNCPVTTEHSPRTYSVMLTRTQLITALDALAIRVNECPKHLLPDVSETINTLHAVLRQTYIA